MDRDSGKEKLVNNTNNSEDTQSSYISSEFLYCLYSIICCGM